MSSAPRRTSPSTIRWWAEPSPAIRPAVVWPQTSLDSGPVQAVLLAPISSADVVVNPYRRDLDSSFALGVPAHVTTVFPFALPGDLGSGQLHRLGAAVRSTPAFGVRFATTAWFGESVLWLRADDESGFRALTDSVYAAFPDHPPYGGAFDDVVPHLTVGTAGPATLEQLRAAEAAVDGKLPVECTVREVVLGVFTEAAGSWEVTHRFPLG